MHCRISLPVLKMIAVNRRIQRFVYDAGAVYVLVS